MYIKTRVCVYHLHLSKDGKQRIRRGEKGRRKEVNGHSSMRWKLIELKAMQTCRHDPSVLMSGHD